MQTTDTIGADPNIPPRGRVPVVGVGLGPRAGVAGLEECLALLWQVPSDGDRAVVVTAAEVGPLSRGSGVPVLPALDGTPVEPGRAYVSAPDTIATLWGDILRVVP